MEPNWELAYYGRSLTKRHGLWRRSFQEASRATHIMDRGCLGWDMRERRVETGGVDRINCSRVWSIENGEEGPYLLRGPTLGAPTWLKPQGYLSPYDLSTRSSQQQTKNLRFQDYGDTTV